jgi:hypothetical protein
LRHTVNTNGEIQNSGDLFPKAAGLRSVMLKVGGTLSRASRRLWLDIAEGIAPLWHALLTRIKKLLPVERIKEPYFNFMPPPAHAFSSYTPRM